MRRSEILRAIGVEQVKETRKGNSMVSKYYKSVAAFVVSFGAFLTATLANPEVAAALPDGATKWLVVVAVPAVVGAGAWLVRNENTVAEAEALVARAQARVNGGQQPE